LFMCVLLRFGNTLVHSYENLPYNKNCNHSSSYETIGIVLNLLEKLKCFSWHSITYPKTHLVIARGEPTSTTIYQKGWMAGGEETLFHWVPV
jgi:hypothetical protein